MQYSHTPEIEVPEEKSRHMASAAYVTQLERLSHLLQELGTEPFTKDLSLLRTAATQVDADTKPAYIDFTKSIRARLSDAEGDKRLLISASNAASILDSGYLWKGKLVN